MPRTRLVYCAGFVLALSQPIYPGGTDDGGCALAGAITSSGGPIQGAQVTVWSKDAEAIVGAQTGPNGHFCLRLSEAGKHSVQVSAPGFATMSVPGVEVGPQQKLELQLSETITLQRASDGVRVTERQEVAPGPLEQWLAAEAADGWALTTAVPKREGLSLFVFARMKAATAAVVFPGDGTPDSATIAELVGQHPERTFVGVHLLPRARYLVLFR